MMDEMSMSTERSSIEWLDWLIIGIMFTLSAATGLYYYFTGSRQRTTEEYFLVDKSIGLTTLAFSMMMAYVSGITVLDISSESYSYGLSIIIIYIGLVIATPIISYFYLPVFYQLGMLSIYEYLERRFGVATRMLGSNIYFLLNCQYAALVMYIPALALQSTTGLNIYASITMIGLICTFYATLGGIKAIMTTSTIHGVFIFICLNCVIGLVINDLEGGTSEVIEKALNGGRLNVFNFSFDPTERHTFWSLTFGGTFLFLSLFACNQLEVQRLLTTKTLQDAQRVLWLKIPIIMVQCLTIAFVGLVLYAYYLHCDPVSARNITSYNMIMPYYAEDRMTRIPGFTGLFIAGVFSASLSTVSAMINSLAAIALSDYIKPLYQRFGTELPDDKATVYVKISSFMIGLISMSIALLASVMGTLAQTIMGVYSAAGGPIFALFTMGMFTETVEEIGAIIGTLVSLITSMSLTFAPKPLSPWLPMSIDGCLNSTLLNSVDDSPADDPTLYFYFNRISYLWIPMLSVNMSMFVGITVSFIVRRFFKASLPTYDLNLFVPMVATRIRKRRERAAKNSQLFILDTLNNSNE